MHRLRRVLAVLAAGALLGVAAPTAMAAHHRLPRPPFPAAATSVTPAAGLPKLRLVTSRRNAITDVRAWFQRNRIVPTEWRIQEDGDVPGPALPRIYPRTFRGAPIVRAIRDGSVVLLVYGGSVGGRYVVGVDPRTGRARWSYDLERWALSPTTPAAQRSFARQGIVWAQVRGRTLYVETAHFGFASESGAHTAYLRAIDLRTSRVRWTSPALTGNALTFVVTGGVILTGYGFTREPDYLFLLNPATGRPVSRLAVPSAPEYIVRRGTSLLVRTYDHDLTVRLARR